MMIEEGSPISISPLLLRNLLTSVFMYAYRPLILLAENYKVLELLRYVLVSSFLFLLSVLPTLIPAGGDNYNNYGHPLKPRKGGQKTTHAQLGGGDTGIGRALSQLLTLVNDIPVSSRKYEVVRTLGEKLLDENLAYGEDALREINCGVLTAAFSRTLSLLEAAMLEQGRVSQFMAEDYRYRAVVGRFLRGVKYYGELLWLRGKPGVELGSSGEKLAAELLWLAQKLVDCGCADEAVSKWALSSNLAWLSLSAEPRIQASLVKISAFLLKQAKQIELEEEEGRKRYQLGELKMRMLMAWVPLLCRGSNGVDAPALSIGEREELEKVLEEMIEGLKREEEKEQVLSLWLQHFTLCASSDWPNLQECYTKWCNTSRTLLLHR